MDKASPTQVLAIFTGLGFSKPRPSVFAFANRTDFGDWLLDLVQILVWGWIPKALIPVYELRRCRCLWTVSTLRPHSTIRQDCSRN